MAAAINFNIAPGLSVRMTKYIPHRPHPRQAIFLMLPHEEALFGGAAGGGKSDALLMAALQYVDIPGYSALILRKSFKDLNEPGAIMDRFKSWMMPYIAKKEVRWNSQDHQATFPSSARITFGFIENDKSLESYQSAEYQLIGWDELTQHEEAHYTFMFSRVRAPVCPLCKYGPSDRNVTKDARGVPQHVPLAHVPQRIRGATNPGNKGHSWVKTRFINPGDPSRPFVPSKLADNPSVDIDQYRRKLQNLDAVKRAQLEDGNWDASIEGAIFKDAFKPEMFVDYAPQGIPLCRGWDLAATEPLPNQREPDYAAGARCSYDPRTQLFYIEHVYRMKGNTGKVETALQMVADHDTVRVPIVVEQEPGSAGKMVISNLKINVLKANLVEGQSASGDKISRIKVVASRCQLGLVRIVRGPWNAPLLAEAALINEEGAYRYDDQWDAIALAYQWLVKKKVARVWGR